MTEPIDPTPTPPERAGFAAKVQSFFFMEGEIREAAVSSYGPGSAGYAEFQRASGMLEAARVILDAHEGLKTSDGTAPALTLVRAASCWGMAAHLLHEDPSAVIADDPNDLWEAFVVSPAGQAILATISLDERVDAEAALRLEPFPNLADMPAGARYRYLSVLRALAERLLKPMERIARRVEAVKALRVIRWVGTAAALVALAAGLPRGVAALRRGPNLALRKPTTSSSFYTGYPSCSGAVDGDVEKIGFHTEETDNPWLLIDLEKPQTVREIDVYNRYEVSERAVPLVVEVSLDNKTFTQVARKNDDFHAWRATFAPREARYVKLTVQKKACFHLNEVEVYLASSGQGTAVPLAESEGRRAARGCRGRGGGRGARRRARSRTRLLVPGEAFA